MREKTCCLHCMDYSFHLAARDLLYPPSHRWERVRCSSMVQCVNKSMAAPLSYFSFQPVFHAWCIKASYVAIQSVRWCIYKMVLKERIAHVVSTAGFLSSWSYFSFQPVLHDWCNKGCGMYYPVCGMMHIKSERVAHVVAAGPLPYVWRHITINKMCWMCC